MEYHSYRFDEIPSDLQMKLVKGSVIPRPIAWITSRNDDGSYNLAPFSYFNMMSSSVLSVSFIRQGEKMKDTARNILREGEAVVQIGDTSLIRQMDLSSAEFLPNESEVDEVGLTLVGSNVVGAKGIVEAKIRMEATLEQHIELMNYNETTVEADLILMRVRAVHVREDVFDEEKEYILHEALDPLARLGGPYYATVKAVEGFARQF